MKYDFNKILESFKPLNLKATHCMDLLLIIRQGLSKRGVELIKTNYNISGLQTIIKDIDGTDYEITIKPLNNDKGVTK